MQLLNVINAPWAIQSAKLVEIQNIYATHLRGEKIDVSAVEAAIGRPLANEPKPYEVIDGVAVVPLQGVLAKRANMFMQISGGTSMQLAERNLRQAANDPTVHSIVLDIDSPGGTVDGTQTLAQTVREIQNTKPVVALASGLMCSAAYWVGSAASQVLVADTTTEVGSIGVVASHMDVSKAEELRGVRTTEITAGKYKRIASQYAPLSADGRAHIQEQVDQLYATFVQAVAANRGTTVDAVLTKMADGRTYMGEAAIQAGLVDGVSTLPALVARLNSERKANTTNPRRAGSAQMGATFNPLEPKKMDASQIAAQHPEAAQALRAEGAATERTRIQSVIGQRIAGHETLVERLAFDGTSTAGDAAMAVLAAERQQRQAHAAALASDAPAPVVMVPTQAAAHAAAPEADRATLHAKAKAYQAAHAGCDYKTAYKAVGGV